MLGDLPLCPCHGLTPLTLGSQGLPLSSVPAAGATLVNMPNRCSSDVPLGRHLLYEPLDRSAPSPPPGGLGTLRAILQVPPAGAGAHPSLFHIWTFWGRFGIFEIGLKWHFSGRGGAWISPQPAVTGSAPRSARSQPSRTAGRSRRVGTEGGMLPRMQDVP